MATGNPTIDAILRTIGGLYGLFSLLGLIPGQVGSVFRRVAADFHGPAK